MIVVVGRLWCHKGKQIGNHEHEEEKWGGREVKDSTTTLCGDNRKDILFVRSQYSAGCSNLIRAFNNN